MHEFRGTVVPPWQRSEPPTDLAHSQQLRALLDARAES